MDAIFLHLERLAEGISDDGWQRLYNELITAIHNVPLEWTFVMRRMVVACDYFHQAARGDLPAEDDESSKEDDDTELDGEDESKSE